MRYNPKSLDNLSYAKGTKWNNKETTTIRIPKKLKEDILDYANAIDKDNIDYHSLLVIVERLIQLREKLGQEKGYKSNNSGKLIKEINELIELIF